MLFAAKKVNLHAVLSEAGKMNFSFFFYSAMMALLAHLSRAIRWRYLIRSFGFNPKLKNVFLSVLFMYFSNLIIPRSGEVARCGTLYKYEKIPVKNLLGTVVVERLFDLITLVFATLVLLVLQLDTVRGIYSGSALPHFVSSLSQYRFWVLTVLLSIVIAMLVVFVWRKKILSLKIFKKIPGFVQEVVAGFKKVLNLENKAAFLGHTVFIWVMYFLMTYVCFFAYPPTSNLGLTAGFAVFMAGSFGMVAPTNGGIGAWHLMVGLALSFFGVSDENGVAITQVAFATMTGAVILFGTVSVILLPFINKKAGRVKSEIE